MATVTDQTLQLSHSPTNRLLELRDMASLDPRMQELFAEIRKLATCHPGELAPIHIRGGSGPERELVARQLHRFSPRAAGPFEAVDCASLSGQALDSRIFGHNRGNFSSAMEELLGAITLARGGTLFLDNLEALPHGLQIQLLSALEHGHLRNTSHDHLPPVDARLVSATEPGLFSRSGEEGFLTGLYYFACALQIDLPALKLPGARRDRPADGA
jgi:DNA-binding NtrC family response regulator